MGGEGGWKGPKIDRRAFVKGAWNAIQFAAPVAVLSLLGWSLNKKLDESSALREWGKDMETLVRTGGPLLDAITKAVIDQLQDGQAPTNTTLRYTTEHILSSDSSARYSFLSKHIQYVDIQVQNIVQEKSKLRPGDIRLRVNLIIKTVPHEDTEETIKEMLVPLPIEVIIYPSDEQRSEVDA